MSSLIKDQSVETACRVAAEFSKTKTNQLVSVGLDKYVSNPDDYGVVDFGFAGKLGSGVTLYATYQHGFLVGGPYYDKVKSGKIKPIAGWIGAILKPDENAADG